MTGTLENPVIGEKNATGDPKIVALVKQWNEKIDSENKLPDTSLSSPNNSAYRTLMTAQSSMGTDLAAGTYILGSGASSGTLNPVASGANVYTAAFQAPPFLFFQSGDYTVAGKTQKLRVTASALVNATKGTLNYTIGLYPVTVAGGVDEIKVTMGTLVSGSEAGFVQPAASTVTNSVGTDFAVPAEGVYALGVVTSGTITNNSALIISARLQTRST